MLTVCALEYIPAGGVMTGVAAAATCVAVVCGAKTAVVSSVNCPVETVELFAANVTVPEGTPGWGSCELACSPNCAVSVVVPAVVVGVGVMVSVPVLGTSEVTVSVTVELGPHRLLELAVLQTMSAAVVPAGEEANAAGTGTLNVVRDMKLGVMFPNDPKTTTLVGPKLLPVSTSLVGAACVLVAELVWGTLVEPIEPIKYGSAIS